jgi:hypothetical protein
MDILNRQNKNNTKIRIWTIILTNLFGIVLSMLYGRFGGIGGDTTPGVFFGITTTGLLSIILIVVFSLLRFKFFLRNFYWMIPILIINYYEMTLIHWDILLKSLFH